MPGTFQTGVIDTSNEIANLLYLYLCTEFQIVLAQTSYELGLH